jgi:hypothetical protein
LQQEGVGELDVPLVGALIGGLFVFLDIGISILFLVFPFFWVLCLIYGGQGFIIEKSPLKG